MQQKRRYFIIVIILVTIIISCIQITNYREKMRGEKPSKMGSLKNYDCVFSINLHENFDFLLKQLQNMKENVRCTYCIIINCNDSMYEECRKRIKKLENFVYVNEIIINKQRFHGSLVEGIYENMVFAVSNMRFEYFIGCSSRNFFTNDMTIEDLRKLKLNDRETTVDTDIFDAASDEVDKRMDMWRWPSMRNTLLMKKILKEKKKYAISPHEGLCLPYPSCLKIVKFLQREEEIRKDLFQFSDCVEEFSLQTIALYCGEKFFYIGNGSTSKEKAPENSKTIFMYKVKRV